ncbi:MAG TPA: AMP-binding protein [Patescibacteria group bacterium]|nr:AMP-binding protein [Patescibacteria group bacterium]
METTVDFEETVLKDHPSRLTVYSLISRWASKTPDSPVVRAKGRAPLTYRGLNSHILKIMDDLNSMGITKNERVALVLPNGPELAVAFFSVSSFATCAPLNPAYRREEFEFYLSDLRPKAIIMQTGLNTAAIDVAQELGLRIIWLKPAVDAAAGTFELVGEKTEHPAEGGFTDPGDLALALHSSGTTSRPKIVPLTNANICAAAINLRDSLQLNGDDVYLNVMPLFHIHGLAVILSMISVGGTIHCSRGFSATSFLDQLVETKATWYTAVPSIHQAALAFAEKQIEKVGRTRLRFIRSSSAALSPGLMARLEEVFGVPVLQSYGLTEACHVSSNPIPPRRRKPGSVGVSAGPEIATIDDNGVVKGPGQVGEIVVRGLNVIDGYENNPEANEGSFRDGWFRTGDEGYLDEEGYLYITDRIKEIINRGGEKISPRELDEVLLGHPDVAEAVSFPIPHPVLGEEIAVALVLREGATLREWDVQSYVASRLAEFKVPRLVLFLNEIPKGPTGKVQRVGLAERLGLVKQDTMPGGGLPSKQDPDPIQDTIAKIWAQVLQVDQASCHSSFFQLGGNSLLGAQIIANLSASFKMPDLPQDFFVKAPTIEKMAEYLKRQLNEQVILKTIRKGGSKTPLYLVHGENGSAEAFSELAGSLGRGRPIYSLEVTYDDGRSSEVGIEEMATRNLLRIKASQPEAPYIIGGLDIGCLVAYEMAHSLMTEGEDVSLLVLFNPPNPKELPGLNYRRPLNGLLKPFSRLIYLLEGSIYNRKKGSVKGRKRVKSMYRAARKYNPGAYHGKILLFTQEREGEETGHSSQLVDAWGEYADMISQLSIPVGGDILKDPWIREPAAEIDRILDEIKGTTTERQGREIQI